MEALQDNDQNPRRELLHYSTQKEVVYVPLETLKRDAELLRDSHDCDRKSEISLCLCPIKLDACQPCSFIAEGETTVEDWLSDSPDDPYLSIMSSALKHRVIDPTEKYSNRANSLHALFVMEGLEDWIEIKTFPHLVSIAESSLQNWKRRSYVGLHFSKQHEANLMLLALAEWMSEGWFILTTSTVS